MEKITVTPTEDSNDNVNIFEVTVGSHKYIVTVTEEYYRKLTGGAMTPEALVEKSFRFLLDREGPDAILPQFALPLISSYFPEYEHAIMQ